MNCLSGIWIQFFIAIKYTLVFIISGFAATERKGKIDATPIISVKPAKVLRTETNSSWSLSFLLNKCQTLLNCDFNLLTTKD